MQTVLCGVQPVAQEPVNGLKITNETYSLCKVRSEFEERVDDLNIPSGECSTLNLLKNKRRRAYRC